MVTTKSGSDANRVTITNNFAKHYADSAMEYANQAKMYADEAKQTEYRVCFVGCVNEKTDNLPINVSIFVDNDDVESFEKYLNDEQDNIFVHASGGNVEY